MLSTATSAAAGTAKPKTNATAADDGIENVTKKKVSFDATFPKPFFTPDQIKSGGFLVYLAGIAYSFLGISLIT